MSRDEIIVDFNMQYAAIAAFYRITSWYTFQVYLLGLGPVFTGDNAQVKEARRRAPNFGPDAYRWATEMDEIAATVGATGLSPGRASLAR